MSTHQQALSGLLFLCLKVLAQPVPWLTIYTHVLKVGGGAVRSPLDTLAAFSPAPA